MNYVLEVKHFRNWQRTNPLSTQAIALWYALMGICNDTGWKKEFTCASSTIETESGLSKSGILRARNVLKQCGLIDFKVKSGRQATSYTIMSFVRQGEPQSEAQSEPQSATQSEPQSEAILKQNKTKLNNREKEKKEKKEKKESVTFKPPTVEMVESYCRECGYDIDAQHFVDYYTANGWMVGKNKMKDWKAAVRNWARRSFTKKEQPRKETMAERAARIERELNGNDNTSDNDVDYGVPY